VPPHGTSLRSGVFADGPAGATARFVPPDGTIGAALGSASAVPPWGGTRTGGFSPGGTNALCGANRGCGSRCIANADVCLVYPSRAMNHDLAQSPYAAWAATISKQNG
jgi:hypothetical protein